MPDKPQAVAFTAGNSTYVLFVLTLTYVVNYLDRQILGILLPYIQKEFTIDDFEAGLLSGTVFAAIYATLSIPFATFADRMNRRNIVALSLATFSIMTVLSGYTTRIWQLMVTRFVTGIGEAGTGPAINSMIADLYPPEKRAGALSFYSAGLNIGLLFGFFGGSWMLQHYGWRSAFIASGAPGLLLVVLLLATVREPIRGQSDKLADERVAPGLLEVVRFLWSQRSFRWIAIGCAMSAFGGYANLYFIPKFLIVSHHMTPVAVGISLSLLTGICGAIGTFMSGVLADRYGKRDINWYMYVPIACTFMAIPFAPVFFLVAEHGGRTHGRDRSGADGCDLSRTVLCDGAGDGSAADAGADRRYPAVRPEPDCARARSRDDRADQRVAEALSRGRFAALGADGRCRDISDGRLLLLAGDEDAETRSGARQFHSGAILTKLLAKGGWPDNSVNFSLAQNGTDGYRSCDEIPEHPERDLCAERVGVRNRHRDTAQSGCRGGSEPGGAGGLAGH